MFRAFWGSRCETRRFKDGTIIESVVWSAVNERLIEEIVRYVAGQHLSGCGEDGQLVRCVSAQLEEALPANASSSNAGEEADALTRKAETALEHLRKLLTSSLKGFPVAIDSLSASSPALRYTSLFPPSPSLLLEPSKAEMRGQLGSMVLRPLHTIATLSSGLWPATLEALRKAKAALIIRLSELLAEQFHMKSVVHETCLDIIVSGYLFRINFYIAQELELCTLQEKGVLYRNFIASPLHSSIIHGLHTRFLSYSAAVRLMHLWLDSEMFSGHFSQEAVELLVAAVYLENGDIPLSSTTGLLKALMKLAEHNWQGAPLVVDILSRDGGGGRSLSSAEVEAVHTAFDALRAKSAMTIVPLFIVSNATRDADGALFPCFSAETESVVLRLIVKSARHTAAKLLEWISDPFYSDGETFVEKLFMNDSNSSGRNVVFTFDRKLVLSKEAAEVSEMNNGNRIWRAFLAGAPFAQIQLFSNLSAKERAFEKMILMCVTFFDEISLSLPIVMI